MLESTAAPESTGARVVGQSTLRSGHFRQADGPPEARTPSLRVAIGDSAAFGQIRIAQLRAGTLGDVRSGSAGVLTPALTRRRTWANESSMSLERR